jgi:hypothetical protein
MSEAKPKEWKAELANDKSCYVIRDAHDWTVAEVWHEASARLIAAAPELLEACEEAQKELLGVSSYLETCEPEIIVQNLDSLVASLQAKLAIVEYAIRKAKGE